MVEDDANGNTRSFPGPNEEMNLTESQKRVIDFFLLLREIKISPEDEELIREKNERSTSRICPIPGTWNKVYMRLIEHARKSTPALPEPPIPLILAGWAYSTDDEKRARWQETLDWARTHNVKELIPIMPEDQVYFASKGQPNSESIE